MSAARKIVAVMLGASQFPLAGFAPNAAFAASATAFREYLERHDGAGLTSDIKSSTCSTTNVVSTIKAISSLSF